MKIAIFQGPEISQSVGDNLNKLEHQASIASSQDVRLMIAPEMFLTGYNLGPEIIAERAEAVDGASSERVAQIARQHDISILYGYPERGGEHIYNSIQLIDNTGASRTNYRKTHLFGDLDKNAFSAGDQFNPVIELEGWKIGVLICYDIEFPENTRHLAMAGADLILVPTALMKPYQFVPEIIVPARACENQVFIAYANRCDVEGELEYYGLSCISGPDGVDLARAGTQEELIVAQLDRTLLDSSRRLNTYMQDRRPELYQHLLN